MGDIADAYLNGEFDFETGEYIGDANKDHYGVDSPGFPVSMSEHPRVRHKAKGPKTPQPRSVCPFCEKQVKQVGLANHIKDSHQNLIDHHKSL